MAQVKGKLVPRGDAPAQDYTGHSVEAMFPVAIKLPDDTKLIRPRYLQADAAADGQFVFDLPDEETITGTSEFIVRSPAGERLTIIEKQKLDNLQIAVNSATPVNLAGGGVSLQPAPAVRFRPLRVVLHDRNDPERQAKRLVLLFGKRIKDDDDPAQPPEILVAADQTDSSGRVRLEVPAISFAELQLEVLGDKSDTRRTVLALTDDGLPPESVDVTVDLPAVESPASDGDCACEVTAPPRVPDHTDLLASDSVFAQDMNGGSCVKLAVPNRTLEEYSFYSLVRTTDPVLWGQKRRRPIRPPISNTALELASQIAFGASALDAQLGKPQDRLRGRRDETVRKSSDELRLDSEAYRASGLISARAWRETTDIESTHKVILEKASSLSEETLRHALSDPDGFTPVSLMTAERRAALDEVERLTSTLSQEVAGRRPVSAENSIQWDANPKTVQATTIAHGHLLEFRQVWKADGYSLGDLVYSLPLAPGQKRRMVIADFDREEIGRRDETRTFREEFRADLSRSRDVSEIVNSTITESIRGGSKANTWGAGGGIGLGIPIGAGFLGIGVAGGAGGASSTAWQNSARGLAAFAAQNLSDRTQQASSAVRSQRATVVVSQHQSESVSVTSEIVANYNHCHATTIQYFEVLKHYRVDQVLSSVSECLFVPLLMTRFDDLKALRWQDILEDRLRKPALRPGFEAIHRIQTGYADADVPLGRYADETVAEVWGELKIELNFARPRLPSEGEDINAYLTSAWNFWDQIFGFGSAEQAYKSNIAGQQLSDKIFANELAPRLARSFCDTLQLWVTLTDGSVIPVTADFTMVSQYQAGHEHLVTFRALSFPAVRRSQIRGITFSSNLEFAPNSRTILRFASISYRNAFRSFMMVPPRRASDDIRPGDSAFLSTASLTRDEEFNPREYDLQLRSDLLKHLNEHVERYHHLIWWLMDIARRFMLLDGFIAPNSGGRSVASVTENRILNIIGNCLVLPVAPGYLLDPTVFRTDENGKPLDLLGVYQPTIPIPPRRITVPTRGVYAEAVMGSCNSCEKTEDDRFWRWEEEPTGDEPPEIGTTSTASRRQAPADTKPTDFPAPVVAIQNAPAAPDPTAMTAFTTLLGQQSLFKDVSGLAQNQANALGAFKQAMQTANNFGKLAAAGAKAVHAQRNSERIMKKVNDARGKKILNDDHAKQVTGKLFGVLNSDLGGGKQSLGEEKPLKDAVDKVLKGPGKKTLNMSSTSGNTSQEAKVELSDGSAPAKPVVHSIATGIVPMVPQVLSKGCWAAALTMLKNWEAQQSIPIETVLAEGGQSYVDKYKNNTGMLPNEVATFMQDFKLRDASIGALTAKGLAQQIEDRGPLWVIADQDETESFSVHARVITGISGDGTPQGTKVIFHDPARDEPNEQTLQQLIIELEQLAQGISSAFGGVAPQILSI
jgi:Papain-like cysteine protease AvrRpt2